MKLTHNKDKNTPFLLCSEYPTSLIPIFAQNGSMDYFSSDFTLGMLGGGQLGKMLLYQTQKYDIRTAVLDPSAASPCKHNCHQFQVGDLMDYETVYRFGKQVDLLTFEIEHVNVSALEQLESEGTTIYPSPTTLKIIQNKITQKKFFEDKCIPTAQFKSYNDCPKDAIPPFVWKTAQFGYDGYGVKVITDSEQMKELSNEPCIIESLINFKYEVAVIVARNSKGQVISYPPVEMEFHPKTNQVEYVICPARISETLQKKATEIALKTSEVFNHVGILAVEMFVTQDDKILVNEVAPRPHNSGHFSIEASYTDQFEQHLRAILGMPLGSTSSKTSGVMVNLVGSEGAYGAPYYEGLEQILSMDGVSPHIYGKRETKPFRKMGHITICNKDVNTARFLAGKVKSTIKVIAKS